jgi:hypothetical protein
LNIYGRDRNNIKDGTRKININSIINEKMDMQDEEEIQIGKKELVEHFKKIILGIWLKRRESIIWGGREPRHAQGKYSVLFVYIENGIEQVLTMETGRILEEIKDAKERKKQEEEERILREKQEREKQERIKKEREEREEQERIQKEKQQKEEKESKGKEETTGIGGGVHPGERDWKEGRWERKEQRVVRKKAISLISLNQIFLSLKKKKKQETSCLFYC